ncbi:MAG: polysaccharide pyruvyl transferase family protein [Muribaculaceae bacterium]|nr:polysaccharide pyruvyl transferase family protein [Muribaculaceae bacterium]
MKIVLNGVETNNKGAELMLYAILQEIERRFPKATVMLPSCNIRQGYSYIKTSLNFRDLSNGKIIQFLNKFHIPGIMRRLHLPYFQFTEYRRVNNADYFIDGSGFTFSDKWNHGKCSYNVWNYRLDHYRKQGTKIVFLPQAFGPIEKEGTKRLVSLLSDKASLIIPREHKSYEYLRNASVNMSKVKMFTDFTSLVDGYVPKEYTHLQGKVAFIPNLRMVDKGTMSMTSYLNLMMNMIDCVRSKGYGVYLLNHEGIGDEELCFKIRECVGDIDIVTGINALEVKGIISTAYMCITSRFHGLASSLNTGVPCLAIGWSHKYEELYKDYGIEGCLLDIKNVDKIKDKIVWLLDSENNRNMREKLQTRFPLIQQETRNMWELIWQL